MKPGEHFPDTTHVETLLLQRLETLRWVACDAHRLTVATFNRAVNPCDDRHAVLANARDHLRAAGRHRLLRKPAKAVTDKARQRASRG